MSSLAEQVKKYVRARQLVRPGERIAAAVSGGADSVALLLLLLESRDELGVVVSVAHVNHRLRGTEADKDERFVRNLADGHGLELHSVRRDTREFAQQNRLGIEAAARRIRYDFFAQLASEHRVNRVATAHSLDDQAETVLMKFTRGAGTRGLAGIYPEHSLASGSVIRPLLQVRREELRAFLLSRGQSWREDASNADDCFTRNRVRARVLPVVRQELNPAVDTALSHVAEICQAEEEYWQEQMRRLLPLMILPGEPARGGGRRQTAATSLSLDLGKLQQQPVAAQRRLLRAAASQLGCELDFEHVECVLDLVKARSSGGASGKIVDLGDDCHARLLFRELRIERREESPPAVDYEYSLNVPGSVDCAETGSHFVVRLETTSDSPEARRLERFTLRNWRAGDRFRPKGHRSQKRLKELLYELHLSPEEKAVWPVVIAGKEIVWVRGIPGDPIQTQAGTAVIEEVRGSQIG